MGIQLTFSDDAGILADIVSPMIGMTTGDYTPTVTTVPITKKVIGMRTQGHYNGAGAPGVENFTLLYADGT